MKWEYKRFSFGNVAVFNKKTRDLTAYIWGSLRPEYHKSELPEKFYSEEEVSAWYFVGETELLNLYGLENWELVSVVAYNQAYTEFYLKRPIVE